MLSRFNLSLQVQKKLRELNLNADDVIRKALDVRSDGLEAEGVFFPEGTALVGWFKDRMYTAIIKDGAVTLVDGESFTALSAAAAKITGHRTTNGWKFWNLVKIAGKNEFVPLTEFREQNKVK